MKTRLLSYPLRVLAASFAISLAVLAATATKAQQTPTCMLTALPSVAVYGMPMRLSWQTTDATSLTISDIGAVSPVDKGTVTTTPSTAGAYSATVEGPGGTGRCSLGLTVQTEGIALTPADYARYRDAGSITTGAPSATTSVSSDTSTTGALISGLLGSILPLPPPGTTPAPIVIVIDQTGRVLVRGVVESVTSSLVTVRSWGGVWTVRSATFGPTTVIPQGPLGTSDMSALRIGDTIGVEGTMSGTIPLTVDAYYLRDWSTNPSSTAPSGETSTTVPQYKG